MILEAFSRVLQQPESRGRTPEAVLHDWLSNILLEPAAPDDHVARVIHAEICIVEPDFEESYLDTEEAFADMTQYLQQTGFESGDLVFMARTPSGERLLSSLVKFCKSYDHWQFCRWLHNVNASDFCRLSEH